MRMETGEFDPASKVAYTSITKAQIESPAHQALAEKVAAQDLVLLQNNNVSGTSSPLLPANPAELNNIVIVGDLANTTTLGGYSGDPDAAGQRRPGDHRSGEGSQSVGDRHVRRLRYRRRPPRRPRRAPATQAAIKAADLVIVFAVPT